MTILGISLGLNAVLSITLWYSVFCRSIRTSSCSTRLDIRVAMWMLGCVSLVSFAAPAIWPGWMPTTLHLLLLGAITLVQVVTAKHWSDGVPSRFLLPHAQPRNRRSTDRTHHATTH